MTNTPMNICMLSNLFHPVMSGSATQTQSLSRELVKRGHNVVVITAKVDKQSPEYECIEGVHIYRLPAIRLPEMGISFNFPWFSYTFTPANMMRIRKIIIRHRCQIMHLHNHMLDLAFSAVLLSRSMKMPLVITFHTIIKHARPLYNLILLPLDRILLKWCVVRQAQCVICPDMNMVDYAVTGFGKDIRKEMIPYGINLLPEPPLGTVSELRKKYGLEEKRVILSLGHVHEIRNRRDLVEAMPSVLKVFPKTVLLIVGAEATRTPSDTARKLGISDAVVFTGPMPYDLVPAFVKLSDIEAHWLTQDSAGKTSLGIATLEVMGAGKTVLAAVNEDTHGHGIIRNGDNLLLVEPHQPEKLARTIIDILGDDERRVRIGRNARSTIRDNFSWDTVCEKTAGLYHKLLDEKRCS
jgi:1,2-diacylglycerol 3-alpha-glucosyltransferase